MPTKREAGSSKAPGAKSDKALDQAPAAARLGGGAAGFAALGLALLCAIGYGATQSGVEPGFAGEVERVWREGELNKGGPGSLVFAAGELRSQFVSDPQFQVAAPGALLARRVETMQWVEDCGQGGCSVALKWRQSWVDAGGFRTRGYENPRPKVSPMAAITRAVVARSGAGPKRQRPGEPIPPASQLLPGEILGGVGVSPAAVLAMAGKVGGPYSVGETDRDFPGWRKLEGAYVDYQGEPGLGATRVSFWVVPNGIPVTVAGRLGSDGDLAAPASAGIDRELVAARGEMSPPELLGLPFWRHPDFGNVLLGLAVFLFVAGCWGLWSLRRMEREMLERRRAALARKRAALAGRAAAKA